VLWGESGRGLDTGDYEVVGAITHKGRSSESGHYVAWLQHKGDVWYKYDDDYVSQAKLDEILALRGGGDWHMAIYLIYKKIEIIKDEDL